MGRSRSSVESWFREIGQWAHGSERKLKLSDAGFNRLSPADLSQAWTSQSEADHPAFASLERIRSVQRDIDQALERLPMHAARWCAHRMRAERRSAGKLGFDDLLLQLDEALRKPGGIRLAEAIRAQHPVALIDEFQDTDPVQYRIFDAIYGGTATSQATAMLMIGDPKQAIYGFRGADVHTYLEAREQVKDQRDSLAVNHRSSSRMVESVNRIFQQADSREQARGAFMFGDLLPRSSLSFQPVRAAGLDESWVIDGDDAAALTLWTSIEGDKGPAANGLEQHFAELCANEIARLLISGAQGRTGFRDAAGVIRSVTPADIAILVNNASQASRIRRELSARGIGSVYLSEQESVFDSAIAFDMQILLQACAEPADEDRLRAALGTATLGVAWSAIDRCNEDEMEWEDRLMQFQRYQQLWRRSGVLSMLHQLIHDFGVAHRLLADNRERELTDLLHLAEWLQQASQTLEGENALIRRYIEQRTGDETARDNPLLRRRLESDAALVKVVTIHKSKGLEYPLVFLPFAWATRQVSKRDEFVKWHDPTLGLRVSTAFSDTEIRQSDRERLAEDIRKLYVALTRARHATWVAVPPAASLPNTALGFLLIGESGAATNDLDAALKALTVADKEIAIARPPQGERLRFQSRVMKNQWREALTPASRRDRPWWISSYSALTQRLQAADQIESPPEPSPTGTREEPTAESDRFEQLSRIVGGPTEGTAARRDSIIDFPRGAQPGTFLHSLFEWLGREGFSRCASTPQAVAAALTEKCRNAGYSQWAPWLIDWLQHWLETPLPLVSGDQLRPDDLFAPTMTPAALRRYQVELEFWIPANALDTDRLDETVIQHTLGSLPRPRVSRQTVNGMLKGFMDLVFEHEGRYFVLDYKSNHLGATASEYTEERMRGEILSHRYDLQYVLYIFALHRLLRSRLGEQYRYDEHIGGAACCFIRGHDSASRGIFFERPSADLMLSLDELFEAQ